MPRAEEQFSVYVKPYQIYPLIRPPLPLAQISSHAAFVPGTGSTTAGGLIIEEPMYAVWNPSRLGQVRESVMDAAFQNDISETLWKGTKQPVASMAERAKGLFKR